MLSGPTAASLSASGILLAAAATAPTTTVLLVSNLSEEVSETVVYGI